MLLQALCIISYPSVISNWRYSPKTPNLGQNRRTDDKPVVGKVHDVSFDVTTPIGLTSVGWMSMVQPKGFKWGLWVQKLVSRAWMSNCIKHNIMGCNCLSMPYILVSGTKVLKFFFVICIKDNKKVFVFLFLMISYRYISFIDDLPIGYKSYR